MMNATEWRVIGLWRVWDELPDAPMPTERAPEALLQRVADTFDHRPTAAEAEQATVVAGTAMRRAFEARETIGHAIVDETAWASMQAEGGWLPEGIRRHPPGGRHLLALLGYDLAMVAANSLWRHAETDRAPAEDVVARLRLAGDALGLPPVELDSGLPVFASREVQTPYRRRGANRVRDRDGGSL